ncbi:MAG: hypothetical protein AABX00_06220 [Nanoarchaeota archaeon]
MNKNKIKPKILWMLPLFAFLLIVFGNNVFAATEQDASLSINKAENKISYLNTIGISTARLSDLLNDAKISFEAKNYQEVADTGAQIESLAAFSVKLRADIAALSGMIDSGKSAGLDTSSAELSIGAAKSEFSAENYELASYHFKQAESSANEIFSSQLILSAAELNKSGVLLSEAGITLDVVAEKQDAAEKMIASGEFSGAMPLITETNLLANLTRALAEASKSSSELSEAGISTPVLEDTIKEAVFSLEQHDYTRAISLLAEFDSTKNRMLGILEYMDNIEKSIATAEADGIGASSTRNLLAKSRAEFALNHFDDAESLAKQSEENLKSLESSSLIFGALGRKRIVFDVFSFFKSHWLAIIAVLAAIAAAWKYSHEAISLKILAKKLAALKKEKETIMAMIKQAQEDYFKKKSMNENSYNNLVDNHQQRLMEIEEKLTMIESKLKKQNEKNSNIRKA